MPPFDPALSVKEITDQLQGRYSSLAVIKAGGQGSVFRATIGDGQEVPAGTVVALKVYYADQIEARTDREIAALKRLAIPSIVRFVGSTTAQIRGAPCLLLETSFVEGESLAAMLVRGPLAVPAIARVVHDVGIAIDAIWSERIVHRDIKPDNIMVTGTGDAVLIDLGLARHTSLTTLTNTGMTCGTLGYLSPEQAAALRQLSCKSDVFALGIVAQEALLGRHPTGRQQAPLISDGGPATGRLVPGAPEELSRFIDRMVDRHPVRRPLPVEVSEMMLGFMTP